MTHKHHLVTGALIVAMVAFSMGAGIFQRDWQMCTEHHGGRECREPRDRAVLAWAGLAVNAVTLVTNILDVK